MSCHRGTEPQRIRLVLFFCFLALCVSVPPWQFSGATTQEKPQRIISVVPAATEMLYAMGAGPRIVGVSSFDDYPPEVLTMTRVGGLLDPHVERILSLRPDLVVVYATQADLRAQLARAKIPIFGYEHAGLGDITATIRALGQRVGSASEAERVASQIEGALRSVRARVAGRPRPRTLLVFGREPVALRAIHASGGIGFLHDVLEVAGGLNVFADVARQSVQVSTELVLTSAPEAIVDLKYGGSTLTDEQVAQERAVWNALPAVPAVRNGRVYVLVGDEMVVPGPRIVRAAERLARVLHPEAFAGGGRR